MAKITCLDVAQYILEKLGTMTTWKLQKLCYYSQAWSLVWDEKPLFDERIEAWANAPVIPALYEKHKGEYYIKSIDSGNPKALKKAQRETIDVVLGSYGTLDSNSLSAMAHREDPWINARERDGLNPGERGNSVITLDDMSEYYGGLYAKLVDMSFSFGLP